MLNDEELERASAQLEDFGAQSERFQQTRTDVLEQYRTLIQDYKRLKSDFEEERDSRERYKQMVKGQERNPFVLILIDGDGYIFDDDLISNGADGGQRAAQLLNDTIKKSLRSRGLDHCRIMVRIYTNLHGLSKAVHKAGLCGAEKRSLSTFAASFTRSNDLFDFVDAGELKENADYKIRAMFRQFVDNVQCRHIFFAGCHDVGYLTELTPYASNRDRITLIRNHSFHREFAKLGLPVEEFRHVFRATSLDGAHPTKVLPMAQAPTLVGSADDNRPICHFNQKGTCKYGTTCRNRHIDKSATPAQYNNLGKTKQSESAISDVGSLDGHGGLALTTDILLALPRIENIPPNYVPVNASQQRLDPYIPSPTSQERAGFHSRHNAHKLCNDHHLTGYCASGDACAYDHDPISPGILNCLRQMARSVPCPRKSMCLSVKCTRGHICQRIDCRFRDGKAPCKIPYAAHNVDLTFAEYVPSIEAINGKPIDDHKRTDHRGGQSPTSSVDLDLGGESTGLAVFYSDSDDGAVYLQPDSNRNDDDTLPHPWLPSMDRIPSHAFTRDSQSRPF